MRPERWHSERYEDDVSRQHKGKNSKHAKPSQPSSVLRVCPLIKVVEQGAPQQPVQQTERIRERIENNQRHVNRGNQRKPKWCKRRPCEHPLLGY